MQQLLLLAIRGVLHKNVSGVFIEFYNFFKQLCSKVLSTNQLQWLENDIIVILCKLEWIFPPLFFDIMMYLLCIWKWSKDCWTCAISLDVPYWMVLLWFRTPHLTLFHIMFNSLICLLVYIWLIIGTYTF